MANKCKLVEHQDGSGRKTLFFVCPGCGYPHGPTVEGPGDWTWNGNLESPTIMPSILCNQNHPESRCHSFVENGQIRFLTDCYHELAGKTVDLPDYDKTAWGRSE